MTQELFQMALNVTEPWLVKDLQFDADRKRLDIYIDFKPGSTFEYFDKESQIELAGLKAYDTKEKTWRHLNFFEHECYLHARVPRVKLPNGKTKLIKTPWEGLSNGFTLLFEALLMQLCHAMPIKQAGRLTEVNDDKIWQMLERYIDQTRAYEDFRAVESIGIDETSRAKGHDYVTLFVDLQQRRTLFVTEGKGHMTVKHFNEDFAKHNGDADQIKHVSCDMSPAFIKGVGEYLSNASITFDKFHILKIINDAVDKIRREESRQNKLLKGTRYIWLKNKNNLTTKQKERLEAFTLSQINSKTLRAYNIRQAFQDIYQAGTKEEFITYLNKWYFWATHSKLSPMIEAAKTIKRHWDGIVRWYESRINNGILEGLNSVIQATKAKARGYRTFKNFKIIVYLLTGKLNFSLVNSRFKEI